MKTNLYCMIVALISICIGTVLGYQKGNAETISKSKIQATHFCEAVGKELDHISYQTKAKRWSIQCK